MKNQPTDELNRCLEMISDQSFQDYLSKIEEAPTIAEYLNLYINQHDIKKSDIVKRSCISKGYIYEVFNGKKQNPSRDYLLAICLACRMDLYQVQHALRIAKCGELYAKVPRDAAIMLKINQRCYSLAEIDDFLTKHKLENLVI